MNKTGIEIVRGTFREVLEGPNFNTALIAKYFNNGYIQFVDGKELGYNQFVKHVEAQKKVMDTLSISFKSIIQENDIVFSNHIAMN